MGKMPVVGFAGLFLAGAVLSLFGSSAPSVAVLCAVAGLVLLGAAGWQACRLLQLRQPAPAFAAFLIVTSPMLVAISFGAYINLPFAVLFLWALVWELRERPRMAWTLLVTAGLVRPEGWAFLLAYGALEVWRSWRPRRWRRVAGIVALAVGPILIGTSRPAHILTPSVTARGILNMTAIAAVEAQERAGRQQPTLFG